MPSSLIIRRPAFTALGGFPTDAFFRSYGGEDGAFSWALREVFGNQRLIDAKRVRMHFHPGVHAERYFRIFMGVQQARPEDVEQALRLSEAFVEAAKANIAQLRAFSAPTDTPAQAS